MNGNEDEGDLFEDCVVLGSIPVCGERFELEFEGGHFYLRHLRWSLVGLGKTILEAQEDLVAEARDALAVFSAVDLSEESAESRRLKDFLVRIADAVETL